MQRLDLYLFTNNFVKSRKQAQDIIKDNGVMVDGKIVNKPSFLVDENYCIEITKKLCPYVSRAGYKLEGAKEKFNLDFFDKVVLDIGSSTGGFTDFCLQNGAKKVYSVDVGTNQLDISLKNNKKVVSLENTDIRNIDEKNFKDVDVIVCDVSFISLTLISQKIASILRQNCYCIVLIKPQFECGKEIAKKYKGIIKDEKIHKLVIDKVVKDFDENGLILKNIAKSKILGGDGNTEFVAQFIKFF